MSRAGLRHAAAISVAVLTAAGVFAALASGESASAVNPFVGLLLPATLIGLLLVAFVLLPLWTLCARARSRARLRFALVAAAMWTLVCIAVAAITGVDLQETLRGLPELLLPGWVLVAMFGVLAEKRGFPGAKS